MRFRILGPLEVWTDGSWQSVTAEKQRVLLACLLLRPGQIVSTDTLMDEVWGDDPPAKAKNLISIYVLRLRRLLGDPDGKVLAYRAPGYVINVAAGDLDATHFETLVADGRQALDEGDPVRAAALLAAGLGLWRGQVLADVPLTTTLTKRLDQYRLTAIEVWAAASIASDRHDEAILQLRDLVAEHPLREGLWLQLMRALAGAGRPAEALAAYAQARAAIAEELGVDPGPQLQDLHADLLAADAAIPAGEAPGTIAMGTFIEQPLAAGERAAGAGATGAGGTVPPPSAAADPSIPRPAQLPADIGDFTGRGEHVQYLCDMLTRGSSAGPGAVPIAFVAGAGGLGKTTLAVHAAHQLRPQFPDGQLYVDLLGATAQPLHPGDVLARLLRDLGVPGDNVPAGDEERAALYRTRLTGRRILIVLDNARDTAQVRPLLPGSASCAVLVTTRNRTADLASTRFVDLHVLDDDDALALFTRILGDDRALAEPEATAEVLEACAGLPLAIRICAARLAARSHWRIATMAARLRDQRRRLDELKVGDLAVRASFRVSYDSLVPGDYVDPARLFRLLGLWQGPTISLRAATALLGASGEDADPVADALEGLVDAHLLESPEPDWYRFHDLLRVFALERARAEEPAGQQDAALERLLRWYLHAADGAAHVVAPHRTYIPLPEEADYPAEGRAPSTVAGLAIGRASGGTGGRPSGGQPEDALAWYDSERANIVAATRQAAQAGLHDVAWRLPAGLYPVFSRRSNWADVITTHRIALDSAQRAGDLAGEGWTRNNLGFALARLGDAEALGHLERALAIRVETGDRAGQAQTAISLADAYLQLRGPEAALEPYQRSVAVLHEAGNLALLVVGLNNLGEVYLELGRLDEAADCLRQARDAAAGQRVYGLAHALHNLGRVENELGRPEDAVASLREGLRLHEDNGDLHGQAIALDYLGRARQAAGDAPGARDHWTRARDIYRQLGRDAEADAVEAALSAL